MAFDPKFKMSIQDASGNYYSASLSTDNVWTVETTPDITYLPELPAGWDETSITWERHNKYKGVFRSQSNAPFKFAKSARAIIKSIRSAQGIKGYGLLTIYMFNPADFTYPVFYQSQLDFKTFKNIMQSYLIEIGTLDSGLVRDFAAYGDTKFNIPIWQPDGGGGWITDANWILHDGIKLLYNATYSSSANKNNPLIYDAGGSVVIGGFNRGRHGSSPTTGGFHTIPEMEQLNIVQNNGTTTYIGNDILQPFLIQGTQHNSVNGTAPGEENFAGVNNSQPYTTGNNSLKNFLANAAGSIDMSVNISATILGSTGFPSGSAIDGGGSLNPFLGFVLFEIGPKDVVTPDPITGEYSYIPIYRQPFLPLLGLPGDFVINETVDITLRYDRVYLFSLICDDLVDPINELHGIQTVRFSNLQFSFLSKFDGGVSGIPIAAPSLPPSVFAGFRLHQLLEKIVPYLATTNTDNYGFPIPVSTPYSGVSTLLSNPAQPPIGDLVPYQVMITSAYCVHDLQGQSYISLSLNQLFDFCNKVAGCGLSVLDNTLRIEDLKYFFDNTTMILDLGYDVAEMEIVQAASEIGLGANLKLGYSKADLNSDFGVDVFNSELYFNTPATEVPGVMDFEESAILTEQTAIEKIRAQKVNQPIGSSFDPASPSGDNQPIALYCRPTTTAILPMIDPLYPQYNFQPYDPNNTPVAVQVYQLTQHTGAAPPTGGAYSPAAQSADPTAASAPYIKGLFYPDTAFNVELSPCRMLQRSSGAWLHSVLDLMDSEYLTFRNTYIMQYNNQTLALSGIESNLRIGAGAGVVTEMQDVAISSLPPQLFKPILLKVKSKYPVNMYNILNTNPNGYIRFFWANEGYGFTEYRMFLTKATQAAGNGAATEFEGWATPDMVI